MARKNFEVFKNSKTQAIESFRVSGHTEVVGGWCPGEGLETSSPFPIPYPMHQSIQLFLYNEYVIVSKNFPEFPEPFLANY